MKAGTEVHPISAENQLNAAGLGWIYALAGLIGDARKVIEQFKELEAQADVDYYNVAVVHAGLSDKDRTFEALESAYAQRSAAWPLSTPIPSSKNCVQTRDIRTFSPVLACHNKNHRSR